jgi:hypothetical protein
MKWEMILIVRLSITLYYRSVANKTGHIFPFQETYRAAYRTFMISVTHVGALPLGPLNRVCNFSF